MLLIITSPITDAFIEMFPMSVVNKDVL